MNTPNQHHFPTGLDTSALPVVVDRATWQTGTGHAADSGKGAHPRRGCNRGGSKAPADGGGRPHHSASWPAWAGHVALGLRGSSATHRLLSHVAPGQPASAQCEGCTFSNSQVRELSYLHSRDVSYATFCEGPYEESIALPRLHGLGRSLVLGAAGRRGPAGRRPTLRHPGQLSPRR